MFHQDHLPWNTQLLKATMQGDVNMVGTKDRAARDPPWSGAGRESGRSEQKWI
jgi:hypothetical protein